MLRKTFKVHSSVLYDPKKKGFRKNVSIEVDRESGSIIGIFNRNDGDEPLQLANGDIDLRGKVVMPGFVDSHTHVFLHSYTYVDSFTISMDITDNSSTL